MGHVEDRWFKTVEGPDGKDLRVRTDRHGLGLRYRVRYIAPDGKERSKSFPDRAKRAADEFLNNIEADKTRGSYVDPNRGKKPFAELADAWVTNGRFDESTRSIVANRVKNHLVPFFGKRPINAVYPGTLREWDTWLIDKGLSTNTRVVLFAHMSAILTAAVEDGRIVKNPITARSAAAPKQQVNKIVPWEAERVAAVRAHMPARYRVFVDVAVGCGTRAGEAFGLSPDDFDFDGGWVNIRRQVKLVGSRPVFGLPKNDKERQSPLPHHVARSVRAHLQQLPAIPVTLPWEDPVRGKPVTVHLLMTTSKRRALRLPMFYANAWKPGLTGAGVEPERGNGTHALRHLFASVLLADGASVRDVAEWMGHSDPAFTLRIYGHLMPESPGRARRAIDAFLGDAETSDGPPTAQEEG